jgi:hypothetical protein
MTKMSHLKIALGMKDYKYNGQAIYLDKEDTELIIEMVEESTDRILSTLRGDHQRESLVLWQHEVEFIHDLIDAGYLKKKYKTIKLRSALHYKGMKIKEGI